MLHIATVHYRSPAWIEIQASHLRKHISTPYQTWGSLELIDHSYSRCFDHVSYDTGPHSDKLNHLATEISREASDGDLLMFLDGDAFPIADPMGLIADGLARAPLVAVRRAENLDDPQPHPCFCVTTVSTWRALGGDWSPGYEWVNSEGNLVTDVGGNLLHQLELTKTAWVDVLRSNRKNPDPILFGVYGDTIYHHGAGFRGAGDLTRLHATLGPARGSLTSIPIVRRVSRRINYERGRRARRGLERRSARILAKIQRGDEGWLAELM